MQMHDRGPQDRSASRLLRRECARKAWKCALANGRTDSHMLPDKALELRILQLYIWALHAKRFIDGCRTATVARYGAYEVRVVEPLLDPQHDTIPFWVELFDHQSAVMIDSCGGYDFEETAAGAAALISQASLLHRDAIACRQVVSAVVGR